MIAPYHTVPYRAVPCRTVPCHAVPCHAMSCHAMPCNAIQYITCLFLIFMFWHRQASFEWKWDNLSSSAECRIRSWGVWDTIPPTDWMPTHTLIFHTLHMHTYASRLRLGKIYIVTLDLNWMWIKCMCDSTRTDLRSFNVDRKRHL